METTTSLKTFEVTIPEKYADILKKFITSLEGKVSIPVMSGRTLWVLLRTVL